MRMASSLAKGCKSFALEGKVCNVYRYKGIDKLISLTPVVITLQNRRYLTADESDKIAESITNNAIRNEISQNMKLPNGGHLPIFIIGDTFNRVVFQIDGYTIGTGEQLIKTINGL